TVLLILAIFPVSVWMFLVIRKEKMPEISQHEIVVQIEWNENIHLEENQKRSQALLAYMKPQLTASSALIGQQQFLLNRERELTVSVWEFYTAVADSAGLAGLRGSVAAYLAGTLPEAILSFAPTGTGFDRLFSTAGPDRRLGYYPRNRREMPGQDSIRAWEQR